MIVEALIAVALAARPPVTVTLDKTTAAPGDQIAVRLAAPSRVRLYLVPSSVRPRSPFDARIHFVARALRRGSPTFVVPPLGSGTYAVGVWCPRCRPVFFVPRARLEVESPAATSESCPVSLPSGGPPPGLREGSWYGNGSLWTGLPADGVYRPIRAEPDGSTGTKLFWYAAAVDGELSVRGRRLDAASPPLVVHGVNRGWATGFRGSATWATPVTFPTTGCWKLVARVADVTLSFVLKVVPPS